MSVSGLDKDGDWTFGAGRASYKTQQRAIAQNVVTRLRSFTDDWLHDINHGSPWLTLLGQRGNEGRVRREVESVVLQTEGVIAIVALDATLNKNRELAINLTYRDVYGDNQMTTGLTL